MIVTEDAVDLIVETDCGHDPDDLFTLCYLVAAGVSRAGGVKQRTARQREWDEKYGASQWAVGYTIDAAFVLQDAALESIEMRIE